MPSKFIKGQTVTLERDFHFEDRMRWFQMDVEAPRKKKLYVVREVVPDGEGGFSLRLEEIRNPLRMCMGRMEEPAFSEEIFLDATHLLDSRQWMHQLTADLLDYFRTGPARPSEDKPTLIKSIMNHLEYLRDNMTDQDRSKAFDNLMETNIRDLQLLDQSYEQQVQRKMGKEMGL